MAARAEAARRKRLLQARIGAGVAGAAGPRRGASGSSPRSAAAAKSPPRSAAGHRPPASGPGSVGRRRKAGPPPRRQGRRHAAHDRAEHRLPDHDVQHQPRRRSRSRWTCRRRRAPRPASPTWRQEVLRQHVVPPARADDLRAAVRRPEANTGRARPTGSPTRTCPTGAAARATPMATVANGQRSASRHQRQPVLLHLRHDRQHGGRPLGPNYRVLGRVIEGLDIIKKVAAGGDEGACGRQARARRRSSSRSTSVTVSERRRTRRRHPRRRRRPQRRRPPHPEPGRPTASPTAVSSVDLSRPSSVTDDAAVS